MNTSGRSLPGFLTRRPLLSFFVLSYFFFWQLVALMVAVILSLGLNPGALPGWLMPFLVILFSWMPNLAALVMTGMLEGRAGVGRLFGQFIQFRLPARWYFAALIPIALAFAAASLYRLAGGSASGGVRLTPGFWVLLVVINLLEGPGGEEAGWRGFALPRFLEKYSPLKAGLLLGFIWAFWHLPLWALSGYSGLELLRYCLFFIAGITSLSLLMTWIYRQTSNSLVPMTLIHLAYNASLALVGAKGIGLGPVLPLFEIMAGLTVLAVLIVWACGGLSAQTNS